MTIARSKITAQGQISVPAKVRQKLGVGPGSILTWSEEEGRIVVGRASAHTSQDVHAALFPDGANKSKSLKDLKGGPARHLRAKHADKKHARKKPSKAGK